MQGQHTYPWRDAIRMLSLRRFSSSSEVLGKEEGLTITTYSDRAQVGHTAANFLRPRSQLLCKGRVTH